MDRTLAYEHVESELADFSYPLLRDDAAAELADVTVTFSDGPEANLGALVSETSSDAFEGLATLQAELDEVVDGQVRD